MLALCHIYYKTFVVFFLAIFLAIFHMLLETLAESGTWMETAWPAVCSSMSDERHSFCMSS